MKIGRWQWNYYRYRRETVKGVLLHFDTRVSQQRVLRRRLKVLSRSPHRCDITWFSYAIAYIERSNPLERFTAQLERQALDLLLQVGIVPPKSTLSGFVADLFAARVNVSRGDDRVRYQLLTNYCQPTYPVDQRALDGIDPPRAASSPHKLATVRDIRTLRFSGELLDAEYLCRSCPDNDVAGEQILIKAQGLGRMHRITLEECRDLSAQQRGELWLLSKAIPSRQWITASVLEYPLPNDVKILKDQINGFYRYDTPLLKRLYDYVRFKEEHPIENTVYRTVFSAACLRWLFRANQTDFAREEAREYTALSRLLSEGRTQDALGVMQDVLTRLFVG